MTTNSQTAAVIPSKGIGDALLMMIASHQLKKQGYAVTTFHDLLLELKDWFPGHAFSLPSLELSSFDLIIVENDNSPKIAKLRDAYSTKLSIFYPSYRSGKHLPLTERDRVFSSNKSMAENIAEATASLLKQTKIIKENGCTPPNKEFKEKKYILIHPCSSSEQKNWSKSKYVDLALKLKSAGYAPIFTVHKTEEPDWSFIRSFNLELQVFSSLDDWAHLTLQALLVIGNDSFLGHLASCLDIDTITIASDQKHMQLWRPDWRRGQLIMPSRWIPNFKFGRWRQTKWQKFISVNKVYSAVKTKIT